MMMANVEAAGSVKRFNPLTQYGFILPDGGGEDVYFDQKACMAGGVYATLSEGARVRFLPKQQHDGKWKAVSVSQNEGGNLSGPMGHGMAGPMGHAMAGPMPGPMHGAQSGADSMAPIGMLRGTVKRFNPLTGYGFIVPPGGGDDVYVDIKACIGMNQLHEGQAVDYVPAQSANGKWKALRCSLPGSSSAMDGLAGMDGFGGMGGGMGGMHGGMGGFGAGMDPFAGAMDPFAPMMGGYGGMPGGYGGMGGYGYGGPPPQPPPSAKPVHTGPSAASLAAADQPTIRGTVKRFNPLTQYGFIMPQSGGEDVYVDIKALVGANTLKEGQEVEYVPQERQGRTKALRVTIVGGEPTQAKLQSGVKMRGTIKRFNPTTKYGFAVPEGGGEDVFVHTEACVTAGGPMGDLQQNQVCFFFTSAPEAPITAPSALHTNHTAVLLKVY